ncbi:hypothetical protein ACA910_004051 [Epithemia clementina (nom. ined.)]
MARLSTFCVLLVAILFENCYAEIPTALTCSVKEEDKIDPALREITYDVGDGPQTTMVYVEPDVASFYQLEDPPSTTKVTPKFNGFQGKFINLSPKTVSLYWEDREGGTMHLMRMHKPFTASGTATFPAHRFYFTEPNKPEERLIFLEVKDYPNNLYVYDPLTVPNDPVQTEKNLLALSEKERALYDKWRKTIIFNDYYFNATGRSYLANYLRRPPTHHLWRADYFGQEHWATTRQTHFVENPPQSELAKITMQGKVRKMADSDPVQLAQYRDPSKQILNMTLKVLSCAPRVFEISDFLSPVEVEHILQIAGAHDLRLSATGDGDGSPSEDTRRTRTSFNTWVPREESPIIDAIYRRAADLQRVDESLMRIRDLDERPDVPSRRSLAEHLQLVHYEVGQEYTAHHDFGFSRIEEDNQAARFSTLLLYLNDDVEGGATTFPRFVNGHTFHKLEVKPKAGKAVLFYSQLPDGNMDDYSHHAAEPVRKGEKWLMNLWFWDPIYEK